DPAAAARCATPPRPSARPRADCRSSFSAASRWARRSPGTRAAPESMRRPRRSADWRSPGRSRSAACAARGRHATKTDLSIPPARLQIAEQPDALDGIVDGAPYRAAGDLAFDEEVLGAAADRLRRHALVVQ